RDRADIADAAYVDGHRVYREGSVETIGPAESARTLNTRAALERFLLAQHRRCDDPRIQHEPARRRADPAALHGGEPVHVSERGLKKLDRRREPHVARHILQLDDERAPQRADVYDDGVAIDDVEVPHV